MGSSGSLCILGLSIIGYILGIAGVVAGVLSQAWFVHKSRGSFPDSSEGLIKTCTESTSNGAEHCTDRGGILKFIEDNEFSKGKSYCFFYYLFQFE